MPVRDAVRRIASGVRNRRITRLQPMSTGWCRVRECLEAAEQNRIHGVRRFSLVTSGRALTGRELTRACDYYREMNGRGGIELCASMGLLGADELQILYDAGSGAITAIWRPPFAFRHSLFHPYHRRQDPHHRGCEENRIRNLLWRNRRYGETSPAASGICPDSAPDCS